MADAPDEPPVFELLALLAMLTFWYLMTHPLS
jgi:hypothetical protein